MCVLLSVMSVNEVHDLWMGDLCLHHSRLQTCMFYDAISVFSTFRRGRGFWVADDHVYNLVSGEISVSAALFRSRRSARRPTLGLGSLSVLDAVRCCTARGSKLKVDAIVGSVSRASRCDVGLSIRVISSCGCRLASACEARRTE